MNWSGILIHNSTTEDIQDCACLDCRDTDLLWFRNLMPHAMCVKWVRHDTLQTRWCTFVTKLEQNIQNTKTNSVVHRLHSSGYWELFLYDKVSRQWRWPMVQRCVIFASSISFSGIILGQRKKFNLFNGTSNLTYTIIPTTLLYILTYLLKLVKCTTFFQDELVWC
jgi:hypothetical protein